MKTQYFFLLALLCFFFQASYSQVTRDDINGDWAAQRVTLYSTPEADVMVRVGDIDNLGFGWPANFDPFSGSSTPAHSYPYSPDTNDVDGTDRIMVISSYDGNPPAGQDGYTNTTSRPENLPRPIIMSYDLGGVSVTSASLQIFVDDFQAPLWGANYFVTINSVQAPYLAAQVNTLLQTGPIGKLINVAIPQDQLYLVSSGSLSILFDDLVTGAGDGYAIDFIKLLVNPTAYTYTGTIAGIVNDTDTGDPIAGARVSASGLVETFTAQDGSYTLENVPAGLISIVISAEGFETYYGFVDLQADETETFNVSMEVAVIPECDTLHFPLDGSYTLFYESDEGGYVCGNNSYGDLAKADLFEPAETGKFLYSGLFEFGVGVSSSGQNPDIQFKVWDNSGSGGLPGNVLGTATVPISQILEDIDNLAITEVNFNPPVLISAPFYLGVMLPTDQGDTLALLSTDDGEINPGIAYELWNDQDWYAMSDASSWGLNLGQAIYALYCDEGFGISDFADEPEIQIYPNPARETLNLKLEDQDEVKLSLYNFLGQRSATWRFENTGHVVIPVSHLSAGLYMMEIRGDDFVVSRKIVIME